MHLTFLRPHEKWATTAKTYSKPSKDGLSSDYNLGKYFTYQEHSFRTLRQLADKFRKTENEIAIYGKPLPNLSLLDDKFRRKTENFPYPEDQTLHVFDLDKWPVPAAVKELHAWSLDDPKSTVAVVRDLLTKEGFEILAQAECVVVLTSSMWGTEYLNCHLYYQFTDTVTVEALRAFAVALAKLRQRVVFDQAVYKAVQPQFFTAPQCVGFRDPLEGARIIHAPGQTSTVDTKAFTKLARTIIEQAGWSADSTENKDMSKLGANWQDTICRLAGGDLGVNEPCYRAAAQLVQEVGREYALSHISNLASKMYDLTWRTLMAKDTGRGHSEKDKKTYDRARFRQYIQSATEKPFGREVDQLTGTVRKAIAQAEQGKKEEVVSKPVLQAMVMLKHSHPAKFVLLEEEIKGKGLVSKRNFNMLMKTNTDALTRSQITQGGSGELILPKPGREEDKIDEILSLYEYIEDQYGNKFAAVPGNGDGGYHMMRLNGDMVNVFYRDGLARTGNTCSAAFGKKVLSKLLGEMQKKARKRFTERLVGRRVVAEAQGTEAPSWVNLGLQPSGKHYVLQIAAEGLQLQTAKDCPVKWQKGVEPMNMATDEQITERFGENADLTEYLLDTLPVFISVDQDSLYRAIMWSVSILVDRPLSYIAEFIGGAGCGKSTGADFLKDLLDPSGYPLGIGADRTFFSSVNDDFLADLERRHITILDNQSKLKPNTQDALCMVATGMRTNERVLYTQGQMDRFIRKPLIITGLDAIITRPDLRTRTVQVLFRRARYNGSLFETWGKEKPFLLAALAQVASKTLRLYASVVEPPGDISTRDIFLACVKGALMKFKKPDYKYVRDYRMREAVDEAADTGFLGLFVRFLDHSYKEKGGKLELTTTKLHKHMKVWMYDHAGEDIADRTVNPVDMPITPRGLGWELVKNLELINRVSKNWEYIGKRSDRSRTTHCFERKVNKTLDNLL